MTTPSRWAAAYDALLAACKADGTLSTIFVSDGLPVSAEEMPDILIIGSTGTEGDINAGSVVQNYEDSASGGNAMRTEVARIHCVLVSQSGDPDPSITRDRAFSLMGAVESLLRANPSMGMPQVIRTEIESMEVLVNQNSDGVVFWLPFLVSCTSLI